MNRDHDPILRCSKCDGVGYVPLPISLRRSLDLVIDNPGITVAEMAKRLRSSSPRFLGNHSHRSLRRNAHPTERIE